MPRAQDVVSFLFSPRGQTDRRGHALGLMAVALVCLAAAPFGPFALIGVVAAFWIHACVSARRLRHFGVPGRLAVTPFIVMLIVTVAWVWFNLVTKGFCQGYCADARASDIAALERLDDHGPAAIGLTFLVFTCLLLLIPGRRTVD